MIATAVIMNTISVPLAMAPLGVSGNYRLAAAILYGMALGFILIKSELFSRPVILDALTLRDGRPAKIILSALAFGMIGFVVLRNLGAIQAHVRPTYFFTALVGGIISGLGLALTAMTPVTAVAALGAGRLYAVWVLLGMLAAIPAVHYCEPYLSELITNWGAPVASSLEPETSLWTWNSPPLWIAAICVLLTAIVHFALPDKKS